MIRHFCAADLGLRSDGTGACVVRREDGARRSDRASHHLTLVGWLERRPKPGQPLSPSVVSGEIATLAHTHGCRKVFADLHYAESFREELARRSLRLEHGPGGMTGKLEIWQTVRSEILERRVSIPRIPALIAQLKQVRSKPTSGGGLVIEQPRRAGSHGDLAAAFALAVWAAINDLGDVGYNRRYDRLLPGFRYSSGGSSSYWDWASFADDDDCDDFHINLRSDY